MTTADNKALFLQFVKQPKTNISKVDSQNKENKMRSSLVIDSSSDEDDSKTHNHVTRKPKSIKNVIQHVIDSDDENFPTNGKAEGKSSSPSRCVLSSDEEERNQESKQSFSKAGTKKATIDIDLSDSSDEELKSDRPEKKRRLKLRRAGNGIIKNKKAPKPKQQTKEVVEDESEDEHFTDSDSGSYDSGNEVDQVALLFETCENISGRIKSKLAKFTSPEAAGTNNDVSNDNPFVLKPDFASALFPGSLNLKSYQLIGLNWMNILYSEKVNGILADEMGLGKTVQAMALFALLDKLYSIKGPHLVVAPGSTLENWRRELAKWLPNHAVSVYHGSQADRAKIRRRLKSPNHKMDIILTTYTYFERASGAEDRSFFYKQNFSYVVYDEAHAIKNMQSSRYQRLVKIRCDRRLLLSGTPVQNNLNELLALMSFCMPKIFKAGDEQLIEYFKSDKAKKQLKRIRKALSPFILRRVKADVLHSLASKVEDVRMVKLKEGMQDDLYQSIISDYKKRKASGNTVTAGDSQNVFMQLRKASNHPLLVRNYFGRTVNGVDRDLKKMVKVLADVCAFGPSATESMIQKEIKSYSDWQLHLLAYQYGHRSSILKAMQLPMEALWASAKCMELRELLPRLKAEGHRICLFSQWTTILDILEEVMRSENLSYVRFDGQTAIDDRQVLVDKFNTDKSITAFLLSTRAGGLGINLTSADTVIIHDLDFNPTVDRQAEDRCHRIGQTKTVTVIKLVCKDTVDQGILEMQQRKTALDQNLFLNDPKKSKKADSNAIMDMLNKL